MLMAPRLFGDSSRFPIAREQCNRKSAHQVGQPHRTTVQSFAGQMVSPIAARQIDFRVAPVASQLRHQSRRDRNDRVAAYECNDMVATNSAHLKRLDSHLRAE